MFDLQSSSKYFARRVVTLACLLIFALSIFVIFPLPERALAQSAPRKAMRVLVISLDGLDARYLNNPEQYNLRIPTLRRLMQNGVTARGVTSVYPSVTYPNHTTMVTGALPSRHGIFGNGLFESPDGPQTGGAHWFARDIKVDTLWDAAGREKMSVGMVSWPVAGGAGDWNVPEIWKPGGTTEETRAVVAANARPRGLVKEVERRFPDIYRNLNKDEGDDARTGFAEYIIAEKRPRLMFVHLYDLDHFQHDYGPFTPEALAMLEKTDAYVARLLAAAERAGTLDETTVFITSDHGFLPISKQIHPGVLLLRAGLVEAREERGAEGRVRAKVTNWRAAVYVTGGACAIILRDPNDKDALNKLRRIFKSENNEGILRALEQDEIRALGSNTTAALMLEAADGYTFGSNYAGEFVTKSRSRGMHGYLPTRPNYYASLIASGAGVTRRGRTDEVRMTQLAPTVAILLKLKLRDAEGDALPLQ
ncbi:MAG: ectonucleotide pyrophosphatase/phosphodiesterase [Pyrinomonadaceae bacterium]